MVATPAKLFIAIKMKVRICWSKNENFAFVTYDLTDFVKVVCFLFVYILFCLKSIENIWGARSVSRIQTFLHLCG